MQNKHIKFYGSIFLAICMNCTSSSATEAPPEAESSQNTAEPSPEPPIELDPNYAEESPPDPVQGRPSELPPLRNQISEDADNVKFPVDI